MGKKNIFIGLSTLLLVLLLGLSTRTYAMVTSDELKNFAVYVGVHQGNKTEEYMLNWLESNTWLNFYNPISTYLDNYNYDIFLYSQGSEIYFYYRSINTSSKVYIRNMSSYDVYLGNFNGRRVNTISTSANNSDPYNSAYVNNLKNNYFYTDLDVYASSNSDTITFSSGSCYPSNDILDGPFAPVDQNVIRFEPYPTKISDVYIGQNYNLTAYGCSKNNTYKQMLFGDLIQPPGYFINEINVTMSYYNRGKSKWVEKYLLIETGEDLVPSNYKSSIANFKWQNYDSSTYTITFRALIDNEYVHDDCIYTFTFIGEDSSGRPFYIEQTFYIIGSNTIITDGTLDISFLTNGDYSNDYANDLNELASKIDDQNDLINAVEQGNINSWLPGSGDWSSLIGLVGSGEDIVNTANLWGFRNYTNSYWAGLYEMMNATYTVLSQTGTVALDVSFHGYNHAITSADIPAPPPTIRNTIALCLTTFVMISIYKSFSKKIEKLKMVDTSVLKSEAHDDSDLM